MTLTPRFSAKLRFEGSFVPGAISPETMSSRMHRYRWVYRLSLSIFSNE